MNLRQLAGLLLIAASLAGVIPVIVQFTLVPSSIRTELEYADIISGESCEDLGQVHLFKVSDVVGIAFSFTSSLMVRFQGLKELSLFLVGGTMISTTYMLVVYCAYKIRHTVRETIRRGVRQRSTQKQINCVLVMQVEERASVKRCRLLHLCTPFNTKPLELRHFHFVAKLHPTSSGSNPDVPHHYPSQRSLLRHLYG